MFAASHTFGRCTQIATQLISHDVAGENLRSVRQSVAFALTLLEEAPPRKVGPWCDVPPICIFTDGACEQEGALVSFGAVLIDPMTGVQEVLGAEVPPRVVDAWRAGGRRQVIYFAELCPILIAKRTWWHFIQRRRILFFIDNEAAKFSFVRNYSAQVNATQLLLENAQLDLQSQALCWYSRVPSKSNLTGLLPVRRNGEEAQAEVLEARLGMQQCISRHFPIRHDSRWRAEKNEGCAACC